MKLVRTLARDSIDHAAPGNSISCGVVARDNGKLSDGVRTETEADGTAGRGVRIIIGDDAVNAIAVYLRTSASDAKLLAKSAVPPAAGIARVWLAANGNGPRLQRSKLRPVTSIQREFTRRLTRNDVAEGGIAEFHR